MTLSLFPKEKEVDKTIYREQILPKEPVVLLSVYNVLTSEGLHPAIVLNYFVELLGVQEPIVKRFTGHRKDSEGSNVIEIVIGCVKLEITNYDFGIFLNSRFIKHIDSPFKLGKPLTSKHIKEIKSYIESNAYQFNKLIREENELN